MDIRNFFGGGGAQKRTGAAAQPAEEKVKTKKIKKTEVVDLDELEDSDFEEDDKNEQIDGHIKKRRLLSKKEAEAAKKQKKAAPPAKSSTKNSPSSKTTDESSTVTNHHESKKEVSSPAKEVIDKPAKVAKSVASKKQQSPNMRLKRKEISGGAGAFFGISDNSTATSRQNMESHVQSSSNDKVESKVTVNGDETHLKEEHSPVRQSTSVKRTKLDQSMCGVEKKRDNSVASGVSVDEMKRFVSRKGTEYVACNLKQRADDLVQSGSCSKASQCLIHLRVAFTGVMEKYISRESLQDLYLSHGAKVASNVSGNTHFLIAGDSGLEDGRPVRDGRKYQHAIDKEIPILDEKMSLSLLLYAIDTTSSSNAPSQDMTSSKSDNVPAMSAARAKAIGKAYDAGNTVNKKDIKITESKHKGGEQTNQKTKPSNGHEDAELLWVDKYKPSRLEDVIGGTENIKKLVDWLKRWDAVHIKKTQKVAFNKENPGAKAVLISGPPGIGKTTLATLIATTMGYEVLELNASDARSKSAIEDQVKDVVLSRALSMSGSIKRRLVIMNEVDGMGGSDRGGIPELIKVIKIAKNPIICLCNDRQAMKIKSLAGHCFDIRLRRPTKTSVAQRLVQIGRQEGLNIEVNAAELLVEQMGNDIRQCINAAQMWKAQSNVMRYSDLRAPPPSSYPGSSGAASSETTDGGRLKSIEKDKILRQSPFDACGMILSGNKQDFNERYNSFFIDYSLLPLLVQQNYIDSSQNGLMRSPGKDAAEKLDLLSQAADSVSEMELLGAQVRGNDQHWELLPAQAALSLRVGSVIQGYQSFPTFPQWLGKNSTTTKSKRLTQELVVHTLLRARQGFESMRMEYSCYIRFILLKILKAYGTNDMPANNDGDVHSGVREVISILDSYGLSRDDLMDTMQTLQFVVSKDPQLQDNYAFMDSKLKSAFTREYNSDSHSFQGLVENLDVKKKRRGVVSVEDNDEEGTTEDLSASKEVDDVDSDAELEAFMKKHSKGKGKKGGATKKKAASKKKTK